jgi:2-polyprenyl-3-methyl-5-hydroxy-6-metoxy-1,4-benzoquinol methylase
MVFLGSLKERRCQPEIMDDPALEPTRHMQALRALSRINWISASDRILWNSLAPMARLDPGRTLRVLDVATGGGDVPIRLWRRARRAGLKLDIHGGDISPTAVAVARQKAEAAGADVTFFRLDIHDDIPAGFDVLTCSLFLHHLAEAEALALLSQLRRAAGRMVLINDLRRCRLGFLLAWLATRILTTSAVARVDGPRSVEAAFTLAEVRALADRAGMESAEISRRWPCRYLLAWRRA